MVRIAVPTLQQCAPTISRESRYWARAFRGILDRDDLEQEGRVVAWRKVLIAFDPSRGVQVETLLTLALRNHYRQLLREHRRRWMLPKATTTRVHSTRTPLDGEPARPVIARVDARESLDVRIALHRLSGDHQRLALDLIACGGKIPALATARRWPVSQTRRRVLTLREAMARTLGTGSRARGIMREKSKRRLGSIQRPRRAS